MPVLQNLYQIYKLPSSFIVEHNYNIENYSKSAAIKAQHIVSIGDNLVFRAIRQHYHDTRSHQQIFRDVQSLRKNMKEYKKEGKISEAKIMNRRITDVLFVKDIVNVKIVRKKDAALFGVKGFRLNGIDYVFFCAGSGQIRRDTLTFINKEIYQEINNKLLCGIDKKVKEMNLAKFGAYFALSFSSVLWVRNPRVCVVKDFYKDLPDDEPVDFIEKDDNYKSAIHRYTAKELRDAKKADMNLNCADGQGLIDPAFAQLWGQDMNLSYTPCSFVARSIFIKGNLVTFDFKEYARRHGVTTIYDKWGIPYNIEDIDVILSESQFKMHKYYQSWQEYLRYTKSADICWGVARYNKKYDDEYVLANYQYIQCLSLTRDQIKELIQPTVDWIQKICSGDILHALLFTYGNKDDDADYYSMYTCAQSLSAKAVIKNIDFLQDSYVQHKMYKSLTETINKAKLGKIWLRGNYQFAISDPMAQCQAALGLEPVGLLKANEVYNKFWNDRGQPDIVDICRSPMIDSHEHNPCHLATNEEMEYWYQYLNSGVIFNVYDSSVYRMEDSDFDGDIVLITDNPVFIAGSHKEQPIITYQKGSVPSQKICLTNQMKTNIRGLGTGVGGYSNCAARFYALRDIFTKDTQKEQYNEITLRIKLLREIVGQEIDRIKGVAKPELPKEWREIWRVYPDDTDAVKAEKYKHNSMIVQNDRKPYYFRYRYPELNQRFKQFENAYNQQAKDMFGIKLKALIKKNPKTPEEMALIRRYQKNNPLITSNCNMNILCKELEDIDFDINYNKETISKLPTFEEIYNNQPLDKQKLDTIKQCYQKYNSQKQVKMFEFLINICDDDNISDDEEWDYNEVRITLLDTLREEIRTEITSSAIAPDEFLYFCHLLSKQYHSFNWGFAWDILDTQILSYIPQGVTYAPQQVPAGTPNSQYYLGNYYLLRDVSLDKNKIQQLISDLEDPDVQEEKEEVDLILANLDITEQ